jgi:hypothetical protein
MVGIKEDKQEGANDQINEQQITAPKGMMNQNNTDVTDTSKAAAIGASKGIWSSDTTKGHDHKASGAFS